MRERQMMERNLRGSRKSPEKPPEKEGGAVALTNENL